MAFNMAAFVITVPILAIITQSVTPVWIGLALFFGVFFAGRGIGLAVARRNHSRDREALELDMEDLARSVSDSPPAWPDTTRSHD